MKVVHEWLKEYVGDTLPSVEELEHLFTFHAFEVEETAVINGHKVIDLKILPDRASDCLSHRGIAREIASLTGTPLLHDPFIESASLTPQTEKLNVTIHDTHACRRFTAALVSGVTIKESPAWLVARLHALGQRSINNVVDATNYVMLATGQPLHAYDAQKLSHREGVWHFGVRMARADETVTTLTGDTYTLTSGIQLVVDEATDTPLGIAGIKGGKHAEIDNRTTSIILEAANFDPEITRRAAQQLRLQTDASKRFENNLVPECAAYGVCDVVRLITEIAGGTCEGYIDMYPTPRAQSSVVVTRTQINTLLGLALDTSTIENIYTRLGFTHERTDDTWTVTAPWMRTDIQIPADVIAEIGRVYGYEHVASIKPHAFAQTEVNTRYYYSEIVRTTLMEAGFSEVITTSFRKHDVVCLKNSLASDKGCLRSTLGENIKDALDRNMPNADLLRRTTIELFEIGTVFTKSEAEKGIQEHISLAIGVRHKQTGYTPKDDERLRVVCTLIEERLGVPLHATIMNGVLECNFDTVMSTLPPPTTALPPLIHPEITFTPFSVYPFMSRDIALWTDEAVHAADIDALLKAEGGELLLHTTLFDEFHKGGKVSYAFRLVFQSHERTLTDIEVGDVMQKIIQTLADKGYTVR